MAVWSRPIEAIRGRRCRGGEFAEAKARVPARSRTPVSVLDGLSEVFDHEEGTQAEFDIEDITADAFVLNVVTCSDARSRPFAPGKHSPRRFRGAVFQVEDCTLNLGRL